MKRTAHEALDARIKNLELEEKLRQFENEIRRLKGENPKPEIKPASTKELNPTDKKKHEKKPKDEDIEIDESISLDVPKDDLPKDAKFIGKRSIIIQEIEIKRRNLEIWIGRYWSEELGKVIEAELPAGFKCSQFDPQLRSFFSISIL